MIGLIVIDLNFFRYQPYVNHDFPFGWCL